MEDLCLGLRRWGQARRGVCTFAPGKADVDERQEQRGRQEIELSVGQHEERSWTHLR